MEINLLKQLFTEEKGELFLAPSPFPEKPEDVTKRLGRDQNEVAAQMEGGINEHPI